MRTGAPTCGPETVFRKVGAGRGSPADSDDSRGAFGAGSMALTGNTGFLTSKLVLAFFKTSCVLVTETTKQPPNVEFTRWGHPCPGRVFQGVSAPTSCCPHVPLCPSAFTIPHGTVVPVSLVPWPIWPHCPSTAPWGMRNPHPHPSPISHSRARGHPHWLRMNCSRLSFCRVALCRRSAVL